jgi:hypothetical protein
LFNSKLLNTNPSQLMVHSRPPLPLPVSFLATGVSGYKKLVLQPTTAVLTGLAVASTP